MAVPVTTTTVVAPQRKRLIDRIPVLSQLRQSVGLQRAMLTIGLALGALFVLVAVLAPWIAPYGWAQLGVDG